MKKDKFFFFSEERIRNLSTRQDMKKLKVDEEDLINIPGVGKSIAKDLNNIGIFRVSDLKGLDAEWLYEQANKFAGVQQDRCLLYVFRSSVYFANTVGG